MKPIDGERKLPLVGSGGSVVVFNGLASLLRNGEKMKKLVIRVLEIKRWALRNCPESCPSMIVGTDCFSGIWITACSGRFLTTCTSAGCTSRMLLYLCSESVLAAASV